MARAHAQSHFGAVNDHRDKKALALRKRNVHLRKLKANRASETEEQRRERLRIEDKTRK